MVNRIKPVYWQYNKTETAFVDETKHGKCITYGYQLVGLKRFLDTVVDCRIQVESDLLTSFYSIDGRLVGQIHRHDLNEEGTPYCEHRLFSMRSGN